MDENPYTSNSQDSGNFNQPDPTPESFAAPGHGMYPPEYQMQMQNIPHSKLGIASFVVAIISILGLVLFFVIAVVVGANSDGGLPEESPLVMFLGFCMCSTLLAMIIGLVLGSISMFMPERRKMFGIIGLCINGIVLLVFLGLILISVFMRLNG